ncbi:MAG: thioesterase II family protein [Bacteroidota bacterium]|jgi:medium-chain acyl-[acyl-carrier-protein] hydrolase|nr:thioesterase [Ignavibacteria bacterium]MCU7498560.1 thioesterase [Ignavibacteria bacterium]MCU7519147.1 thioesterase [Ignavibacteria bacterium]
MYFNGKNLADKRLICFPYAGGSSHIFRRWHEALHQHVEVVAVELPGRGRRYTERLYSKLPELVEDLKEKILPYLDKPYYFFGHSMGALIAFEMTQALRKSYLPEPDHIFVSAHPAPNFHKREPSMHNLPEDKFITKLKEMNGMPGEVLKNRELMELMMPILRADFSVCETYTYKPVPKTDCPITVFGGLADDGISLEELEGWAEMTNSSFELNLLPGDHFYITKSEEMLLKILSEKLAHYSVGVSLK